MLACIHETQALDRLVRMRTPVPETRTCSRKKKRGMNGTNSLCLIWRDIVNDHTIIIKKRRPLEPWGWNILGKFQQHTGMRVIIIAWSFNLMQFCDCYQFHDSSSILWTDRVCTDIKAIHRLSIIQSGVWYNSWNTKFDFNCSAAIPALQKQKG